MGESRIVKPPEDSLTQMARRAYHEYAKLHRGVGMKFPTWDDLAIAVKANWKGIVANAIGQSVVFANVNPMNREPHTIMITGFTREQRDAFQAGIEAKMGVQKRSDVYLGECSLGEGCECDPEHKLACANWSEPEGEQS